MTGKGKNGTNGNGKGTGPNGKANGSRVHVPKFSEEDNSKFFEALAKGLPIEWALARAGISSSSYYRMREAAMGATRGKLKEWWEAVTRARADALYDIWRRIEEGGKGTANLMWIAERSYGFVKMERREEQHEHRGSLEITVRRMGVTEDDRRQ